MSAGVRHTAGAPLIVGRDALVRELAQVVAPGDGRRSGAAVIVGPAGVGKTTVGRAVAEALGGRVLTGACLPLAALRVPFLPLRSMFGGTGGFAADFDGPGGPVLSAIDRALDSATAEERTVLIVDDIQWADAATRDALLYLIAGPESRPVSILMTMRDDPDAVADPWLRTAGHLPSCRVVSLSPLDRAGTAEQIAAVLGVPPHQSLVEDVWDHTGGNPYFTALLVTGLEPGARRLPARLPPALDSAIVAETSALGDAVCRVLGALAVAGRPVSATDLARALTSAGDPWAREAPGVEDSLRAAESGVVSATPSGTWWFRQPLTAEALTAQLSERDSRALHLAFLGLADRPTALGLEEMSHLVRHAHAAGRTFEEFEWAVRARDAAEGAGAYETAAAFALRALALHPQLAHADVSERELLTRHLAIAGRASSASDELASVERLLALTGAEDAEQRSLLMTRRIVLRAAVQIADPTPEELAALVAVTDRGPRGAARARALAISAIWTDDPRRAADLAAAAERALGDVGDAGAQAWVLLARMHADHLAGRPEHRLEQADRVAALAIEVGDGIALNIAMQLAASAYGDPSTDLARALRAHRHAAAGRIAPGYLTWKAAWEAEVWFRLGEWSECARALRDALAVFPSPLVDVALRVVAGRLATRQGRREDALMHFTRASEIVQETGAPALPGLALGLAELHLGEGDVVAAADALRAGLASGAPVGVETAEMLALAQRVVADAIEAHVSAEEVDRIRERLDPFDAAQPPGFPADRESAALPLAAAIGVAERARARASGDALDAWLDAKAVAADAGFAWEECYACLRAAEAALAAGRGDRAAAAPLLSRGLGIAVGIGAAPLEVSLRELARFARIPLREGAPRATGPGGSPAPVLPGLTPREAEITELIVAGRTYREIASQLHLSEKTVSSHVSNILRKTGAANRIELSRRATAASSSAASDDQTPDLSRAARA